MDSKDSNINEISGNEEDEYIYSVSWESGVRFVEEKTPNKILKYIAIISTLIITALIGGLIGGYYVKNALETYNYNDAVTKTNTKAVNDTDTNKYHYTTSITAVADAVGPTIVGIDSNIDNWNGQTVKQGSGSGIIFDKNGFIITNYHVIANATKITVSLPGGKRLEAKLIGCDPQTDLAVIRINATNLPSATFGESSNLRVGNTVIAIGNPLGEEYSGEISTGVVSALNKKVLMDNKTFKLIQTDAVINSSNSGGALCSEEGVVIGINTMKVIETANMGFAIPIDEVKPIINQLLKKGYVSRPTLGINYQFLDNNMAEELNIPSGAGIVNIALNEGAFKAGVRIGDIIVELAGQKIRSKDSLTDIINLHKIGDAITAKVYRNKKYFTVNITISDGGAR